MTEPIRAAEDGPLDEPPIAELANLEEPVGPELARRVAAAIDRRETAGHLATLHWLGLGSVLTEFARLGFHARPAAPSFRERLP